MTTNINIFTGSVALLAFVMAFYGLTARERKTPYITGTLYSAVILVLLVIILDLFSRFSRDVYPSFSYILHLIAVASFILAVVFVAMKIFHIYNIHMNFRDDQSWNIPLVRMFRNWRYKRSEKAFEHIPVGIPEALVRTIEKRGFFPQSQLKRAVERNNTKDEMKLSLSTVYKTESWPSADEITSRLAIDFLTHGAYVQYTTCARHPIEFILHLKNSWKQESTMLWEDVRNNVVVVDAYTPHYGFTDTTHVQWTRIINEEIKIKCITSHASYAGIHTSAARAFNIIKEEHKKAQKRARYPTLLIYEGPYCLVDLESIEQYRLFIRHLLPSEKVWGGMFTFLIETALPEKELMLLKSYADITIEGGGSLFNHIVDY